MLSAIVNKASCEACFLMGSVDIVLRSFCEPCDSLLEKNRLDFAPISMATAKEWGEEACRYNGEKGVRETEKAVHKQQFDSVSTVSLF